MSSENIYKLYEDKYGYLWIAARNGLTRIDPTRKIFTRYKHDSANENSIPNNRIFHFQPNTDSTLLLSCDRSGLSEINIRTGQIRRLNPLLITSTGDTVADVWVLQTYTTQNKNIF